MCVRDAVKSWSRTHELDFVTSVSDGLSTQVLLMSGRMCIISADHSPIHTHIHTQSVLIQPGQGIGSDCQRSVGQVMVAILVHHHHICICYARSRFIHMTIFMCSHVVMYNVHPSTLAQVLSGTSTRPADVPASSG
eukprot:6101502-Heterocapsa_arctica.AAC.1